MISAGFADDFGALTEGNDMRLRFLGGDSGQDGSPRLYSTDRDTYVVQGYKVEDAETLSQLKMPDHEGCIEIPRSLLKYFPRD